jgi:hypothetical protein
MVFLNKIETAGIASVPDNHKYGRTCKLDLNSIALKADAVPMSFRQEASFTKHKIITKYCDQTYNYGKGTNDLSSN